MFVRLGNATAALTDLTRAERATSSLEDEGFRVRTAADLNRIKAEVFGSIDLGHSLDAALEHFRRAGPVSRQGELLVRRARTREGLGDTREASQDFHAAVDTFERNRERTRSLSVWSCFHGYGERSGRSS